MHGETQFQVKTDASQLQREMRQAEKQLLQNDDDSLLTAMESIYGTNQRVMEWASQLRLKKIDQNYHDWMSTIQELGGCS